MKIMQIIQIFLTARYVSIVLGSIIVITALYTNFWLVAPSFQAWAQAMNSSSLDLSVSPPVTYLSVKPGESQQHTITIKQNGVTPLTVTPRLVSFKADGSTGQPLLSYSSEFKNFTLELPGAAQSFTLLPGEQKNVGVTFSPPRETTEKEYPLSLVFFTEPLSDSNESEIQTQVTGSIASNIVLLVGQTELDRGKLSVEKIVPPFIVDSLGGLEFEILAKNSGINATNASGSATITNWQGKKVAQFYFFPDMILANSTRLLRNSNDSAHVNLPSLSPQELEEFLDNLDPEQITTQFKYQPTFLIGPYTITTELHSNGQPDQQVNQQPQQISISSVMVLALPYSVIAVGATLLIGWALFYTFKTHNET